MRTLISRLLGCRLSKIIHQSVNLLLGKRDPIAPVRSFELPEQIRDPHESRSESLWIALPRLLGNRFNRFAFYNGRKRRLNVRRETTNLFHRSILEALEPKVMLAVRVWDGGGADDNLSTAANWVGDVAPVMDDDLNFDG
ncbi:MAG: hypothetical protein JNM18_07465, partial [Planctomycetaceae bacterium]|nr:hypothetical protein [Planctomycetaceae bacterium]